MSHIHASGGVDTSPLRAGGSSKRKKKTLPRTRGAPSPVNCREVVDLNVGGTFFTTTAQTLTANGECAFFCRILDDNALFAAPVDQHGRIFVDRDGTLFPFFLNYLRNGCAVVQKRDIHHLYALLQEAEFYGFQDLSDYLRGEIEAMNEEFERIEEERKNGKRTQELLLETLSELKDSARKSAIAARAARVRSAVGRGGNYAETGGLLNPRFGFTRNGRTHNGAGVGEDGDDGEHGAGFRPQAGGATAAAAPPAARAGAGAGEEAGAGQGGGQARGWAWRGEGGAAHDRQGFGEGTAQGRGGAAVSDRGVPPATPRNNRQRVEDGIVGSLRHLMSMTPSVFSRDPW